MQKAAAVLIAREDGYRTAGATNVQVTDNMISDIENATQPGNNRLAAGHAAIDINTGSGSVARVLVAGNQVTRATYDGFRAVGNVCNVQVSRNRFVAIGGAALSSRCVTADGRLDLRRQHTGRRRHRPDRLQRHQLAAGVGRGPGRMPQVRTALRQ